MGWFRSLKQLEDIGEIRNDVIRLKEMVANLQVEKRKLTAQVTLNEEIIRLKETISDLEINKSKIEEIHAREERELRHMVGLERERQKVELTNAKKETSLDVREEALAADKKRFSDEMKFQNDRFSKEVDYLKGILGEILSRLPTVTVDKKIGKSRYFGLGRR